MVKCTCISLYHYTVHCTIRTRDQSVRRQHRRRTSEKSEMVTYKDTTQVANWSCYMWQEIHICFWLRKLLLVIFLEVKPQKICFPQKAEIHDLPPKTIFKIFKITQNNFKTVLKCIQYIMNWKTYFWQKKFPFSSVGN